MQFTQSLIVLFAATMQLNLHGVSAVAIDSSSIAECGTGGLTATDNLPAGTDLSAVRKCANHPLGPHAAPAAASVQLAERSVDGHALFARDCSKPYPLSHYDCDKGYCWKACGVAMSGEWCWLAHAPLGAGKWATCTKASDCAPKNNLYCGRNCGSDSTDCGCSC